MTPKKLTIQADILEQKFMESILNMNESGLEVSFFLELYALAHSWHFDKLNYYLGLIK